MIRRGIFKFVGGVADGRSVHCRIAPYIYVMDQSEYGLDPSFSTDDRLYSICPSIRYELTATSNGLEYHLSEDDDDGY